MSSRLRALWTSRSPGERRWLALLAVMLAAALYLALLLSAQRSRLLLQPEVANLRAQAVIVDASAAEITRLRALPVTPATGSDLRLLVQAQVESAGLGQALTGVEALGANRVRTTFAAVSFSDWLAFVEKLQAQQVRLESTRIEAQPTPGLVAVTATFVRPGA